MKIFLICNPASRGGKSARLCERVFRRLDSWKVQYDHVFTDSLDHAAELSRTLQTGDASTIVAVGGDGTINRVINGFFDDKGKRMSGKKLGIIHTGTSPDFCKTYSIPVLPEKAADAIIAGRTRRVRIGRIESDGGRECRYFGCCANAGFGAPLARMANGGIRKYAGDTAGTLISLVKLFMTYRPSTFRVTLDGVQQIHENVLNISAGLTKYIASGIRICHELRENDTRVYVVIVKNIKWNRLPFLLKILYSGRPIPENGNIVVRYAEKVGIEGEKEGIEIEFDGDPAGFLPCMIGSAPDTLDVITG